MVEKFEVTLPNLTGDRPRKAYVYLPTTYYRDRERRYPVIYMFDGHNLFDDADAYCGRSWRLGDYLDYTDTQVIVAAVECNTEGDGRLQEYSPVDFEMQEGQHIKGKGKLYMDWLTKAFIPYIDKRYRTLTGRENTAIAGSSMGGLMTIYALSQYGKYFSKGAALSPSLWVGYQGDMSFLQKMRNATLYMDYGSKEFNNHFGQRDLFSDTTKTLIQLGVNVTSRIVPNGVHNEASWEKQIPIFMQILGFLPENK